jgi:cytochrome P450
MSSTLAPAPTPVHPAAKLRHVPFWNFIGPGLKLRRGDFTGMLEIANREGDAFCCDLAVQRVVFLSAPELIESLLVKQHKDFHKDPGFEALRYLLGNGLLTSEEEFHLKQRRLIQPAFHKKRIDLYGESMVGYAQEMSARWQDGATMDIHSEMMAVTLSIIAKTLFNADVSSETAKVAEALDTVIHYHERYFSQAAGRFFEMLPIESSRKMKRSLATLDSIIYRFIEEHRRSGQDSGDLLDMLLQGKYEDDGTGMSDKQLRDECITLFLAGHETTAIAMSWTWYLLARHPEIEARLHEEIDRVLQGRPATAADVEHLEYTRRVFTESMRLYPPAFGFGRQAIRDTQLGPYKIRKGDVIVVSSIITQQLDRYYEHPQTFDPDRWLPERSESRHKFAYFPFGGGVRKCIGESFAWMEGILLLATFAQHWKMRLAADARIASEPRITLRPKYGVKMVLEKR